jgi:hypothetical protein
MSERVRRERNKRRIGSALGLDRTDERGKLDEPWGQHRSSTGVG